MIRSFGNQLARDLFFDEKTKAVFRFAPELRRTARRKVLYLYEAAELNDLKVPPGNRLEALKGNWRGYFSIRINNQWRVVFQWLQGDAHDVRVMDYHKG